MTTVRLVLHGKQAQNPAVRAAVGAARAAGHRIEVRVTWEAGDGARLAEEASRLGIERGAAGGQACAMLAGALDACLPEGAPVLGP